jgi:hypothetical protein
MAMKLLAFHKELVPVFASDDQQDNLISLDIIQDAQGPPAAQTRRKDWGRKRLIAFIRYFLAQTDSSCESSKVQDGPLSPNVLSDQ